TAGDQSLFVTEILIQYRSAAIAEHGRQHFKSAGIVGQDTGSVETDSNVVLLDRSALRTVARACLFGLGRSVVALYRRISVVGNTTVEFYRLRDRVLDIDSTGDRNDDVG